MKVGDYISTPRFCTVRIAEIFENEDKAHSSGYTEPTHYINVQYGILGKSTGLNQMEFAGYVK